MRVGSVEETITVTGSSPLVDVQNTRQQTVMTREVIDCDSDRQDRAELRDPRARRGRVVCRQRADSPGRRRQRR